MTKRLGAVVRVLFGWFIFALMWLREIAGWVLMVAGLLVFYYSFALLVGPQRRIITAVLLLAPGFILFRGGIHLLKVSAAALVCLRAQHQASASGEMTGGPRRSSTPTQIPRRTGVFEIGPRSSGR
jgi:hypothetical protein